MEFPGYTPGCEVEEVQVAKRTRTVKAGEEGFGERLERLRKAAGFSMREFAAEAGISPRMLFYYEKSGGMPAVDLAPRLARALGVSVEQLLGMEEVRTSRRNGVRDTRLWRRFKQIEKLPPAERKPIIQVLDAFLSKAASE
jgi:transcriptional regulator with XRE-family HTH domain